MKKTKRPLPITIICILGFIGTIIGILTPLIIFAPQEILLEYNASFSTTYLILTSIISIALLYSFIKIWKMKKLGVYLYIGSSIINYYLAYLEGLLSPKGLIAPAIFIAIFYYYIKKFK